MVAAALSGQRQADGYRWLRRRAALAAHWYHGVMLASAADLVRSWLVARVERPDAAVRGAAGDGGAGYFAPSDALSRDDFLAAGVGDRYTELVAAGANANAPFVADRDDATLCHPRGCGVARPADVPAAVRDASSSRATASDLAACVRRAGLPAGARPLPRAPAC